MLRDGMQVARIRKAVRIVPVQGEAGVILPITIAMKFSVTLMVLPQVGSIVMQTQMLLAQVMRLKI